MPKTPYARIAITLPRRDLAAADRLAAAHDRSRSWIIAEAIRRYAAGAGEDSGRDGGAAARRARTEALTGPPVGLGESRLAQLRRDLALTPEQRVREAEATLQLTELRARPRARQLLAFERYEDFLEFQRTR
jgi:hypothetical protein